MTDFIYEPLDHSTWQEDGKEEYENCRFRAPWSKTLKDLKYELGRLGVNEAVIELDLTRGEIRKDGLPRADAKPRSPAVRLSFEHPEAGPLQYPCDTYDHWQDNVRAIAKTLECQRAMDRYGATRRAQQYRGWQALPPAREMDDQPKSAVAAAQILADHSGMPASEVHKGKPLSTQAYRIAAKATHPDRGGDADTFRRVQAAFEFLNGRGLA